MQLIGLDYLLYWTVQTQTVADGVEGSSVFRGIQHDEDVDEVDEVVEVVFSNTKVIQKDLPR